MFKTAIKFFGIILAGALLLSSFPMTTYAATYVTTGTATRISAMNATLNGFVDTGGVPSSAWFEWGTATSFGNSNSSNPFSFYNGYSGSYSADISGLSANTTYYFRAVAQNSQGRFYGNMSSFITSFSIAGYNNSMLPTAITTSGNIIANNTAQFNALILTGNSTKADTWFEWGTTTNLGNRTDLTQISGMPTAKHTNTITGLTPGTAYYFRAVAQNSYGKSEGIIMSLVTNGTTPVYQNTQKQTEEVAPTIIETTEDTSPTATIVDTPNQNVIYPTSLLKTNVLGAGSFLPVSLFGWLLLTILILILLLLSKHIFYNFSDRKYRDGDPHS